MIRQDVIAALELLEGQVIGGFPKRVDEAIQSTDPRFGSIIYGAGGWNRYLLQGPNDDPHGWFTLTLLTGFCSSSDIEWMTRDARLLGVCVRR